MSGTPTITRIPLSGTSAYVVQGPVPILIDTGMVGQQGMLRANLRRAGLELTDLALVVITHAHSDHAGCLAWLREVTDAAIACSEETMDHLKSGRSACMTPRSLAGRAILPLLAHFAKYPAVEGDVVVREPMTLAPYGIDGVLVRTPGHTCGCLSVIVRDEAVVGDLISGKFARPQIPSVPALLEDRTAWSTSVRDLLDREVRQFHAAHGGPFDASRVAELLKSR